MRKEPASPFLVKAVFWSDGANAGDEFQGGERVPLAIGEVVRRGDSEGNSRVAFQPAAWLGLVEFGASPKKSPEDSGHEDARGLGSLACLLSTIASKQASKEALGLEMGLLDRRLPFS